MAASKPFPGEEQTGVASDSHEACGRLRVYSIDGDQDEAMMVSQILSLMWSDLIFGILGTGLYIGPLCRFSVHYSSRTGGTMGSNWGIIGYGLRVSRLHAKSPTQADLPKNNRWFGLAFV